MSKMDERILVVDRSHLFRNETLAFQGVLMDKDSVKYIMKRFKNYRVVRRGDAEENKALKQPIPYAIITRGDEVFVYKRLTGGGETRLHDSLSIGVGGHMNRTNDVRDWNTNLMINLYRELTEELEIVVDSPFEEPEIIGLINDDENEVGQVHIGILAVLNLPEDAEVTVRETDKLEGYWIRTKDLTKHTLFACLEPWSQIAVEALL